MISEFPTAKVMKEISKTISDKNNSELYYNAIRLILKEITRFSEQGKFNVEFNNYYNSPEYCWIGNFEVSRQIRQFLKDKGYKVSNSKINKNYIIFSISWK